MKRSASSSSGGGRPATERRIDLRSDSSTQGGSVAEVQATCRRIAEYLVEISRDQELEPALQEFLRTFDARRADLDARARVRCEWVITSILRDGPRTRDGQAVRERYDPYFWG